MTLPRFAPPQRNRAPKDWFAGNAILDSQVFSEENATTIVNRVRIAERRLRDGTADAEHFIRLGCAVNVASMRAEEIDVGLIEILDAAGRALMDCQDRRDRLGRYGMTGPGLIALGEGIDAYEAILRASSPKQMQAAEKEVIRRLTSRKGPPA